MSTHKRIAAIQMCSSDVVSENIKVATQLITQAKSHNSAIVILPENFAFIGSDEADKMAIAETFGQGEIQSFLSSTAKKHQVWIIGGTMPLRTKSADKVTSSCLVINPQGQCAARYDKIHLFDVTIPQTGVSYQESAFFEPGKEVVSVATPLGQVGLSVCYDLRFPELYRLLLRQHCSILCIPSAFTEKTGQAHWEVLLRARAIENLSYVLASNQTGIHANGRKSFGHSMIINPWGEIINELKEDIGVITTEIDAEFLEKVRNEFPAIQHRRL